MPIIPTVAIYGHQLLPALQPDLRERDTGLLSLPQQAEQSISELLTARRLGSHDVQVLLASEQVYIIQIVATVMASISITASMTALYWFVLMRRNYRRDLILLLILSDVFKNFCYILYAGVSLTQGQSQEPDAFCQASGYMLQTGLEACDFAVFFISLHMTLQIFPLPNTIIGYEGLYNIRYWVYAIWFLLPVLTASLAFINGNGAYQVQGAWCWLPVRPFWYRLAFAWIPRYIITIAIMLFAIAIYVHVGAEFRFFAGAAGDSSSGGDQSRHRRSTTIEHTNTGTASIVSIPAASAGRDRASDVLESLGGDPDASDTLVTVPSRDGRRHSLPTWHSPFDPLPPSSRHGSHSETNSRRGSRQVTFDFRTPTDELLSPTQQPVIDPIAAVRTTAPASIPEDISTDLPSAVIPTPSSPHSELGQHRRRAVRRQVKSLFVYPVAYLLFWILPFVFHCMNYSDYYAAHPIFALSLLSSWCTTTLGLVDVVIFSWRERPWRHIPGSDGTFSGSFCFWRFRSEMPFVFRRRAVTPSDVGDDKLQQEGTSLLGRIRNSWRRLSSSAGTHAGSEKGPVRSRQKRGGPDSKVRERELAQQRLDREREVQMTQARAEAAVSPTPHSPGARNWFDNFSEVNVLTKSRRPTWSAA